MSRKLGRGLSQLFKDNYDFEEIGENEVIVEIALNELKENPYQPRRKFDEDRINDLARSIEEHGVLQPIIVKRSEVGYYIVAGERRFRACLQLNMKTIPAIVRDLSDQTMAEVALLENLQRENLTVLEEAIAYQRLIERYSLTQQEVSERIGKSRSHITNVLRLLLLPKEVQEMLSNNAIEFGHAKVLAGIQDEALVLHYADLIVKDGLTVRRLEALINEEDKQPKSNKKKAQEKELNVQYQYLQDNLINKLGTSIKIVEKEKGGKLVIDFVDTDDLNRLLDIMNLMEKE